MAEGYLGVPFAVVFFDGERETDIGHVVIYPKTDFRELQSTLSCKIGISPHQFSVFLAKRGNSHWRIPISPKTYFPAICPEDDSVFLVALKRSRRVRKGKNQRHSVYSPSVEPPANLMLLRHDDVVSTGSFAGFDEKDLLVERARFLMNLGMANFRLARETEGLICEECAREKEIGRDYGFHQCVYDAVTIGFKSPAGPIARPTKPAVEAFGITFSPWETKTGAFRF